MALILKLELWPFGVEKDAKTLGAMVIGNDGDSKTRSEGNYRVRLIGKNGKVVRKGKVLKHPRLAVSVWKLVAKALASVGHDLRDSATDSCQQCFGARGGVKGNENVIGGLVLCDYCSADVVEAVRDRRDERAEDLGRRAVR